MVAPFRLLGDRAKDVPPVLTRVSELGNDGDVKPEIGSLPDPAQPSAEECPLGTSPAQAPPEEPMGGSGLTPPSSPPQFPRQPITPKRQASLLQSTAPPTLDGPFSTCVAETLIVGPHGIMSLAPTPTIVRVEQLCKNRDMDGAIALVDDERRKGRRGEVDADKVRPCPSTASFDVLMTGNTPGHCPVLAPLPGTAAILERSFRTCRRVSC